MKSIKNILQGKMNFLGNKKLKFLKHNKFLKLPEQDVIKNLTTCRAIWFRMIKNIIEMKRTFKIKMIRVWLIESMF